MRRDSLPSSTGRRGGDSDPQTTAFPARRPSVCYTARRPLLIWSAGHGSFFSACRPSVCYTYTARWPTFDYGPTTTLSTGTQVVRLLYCPPAPAYDWSADHSFSLPACRPPVCPILQAGPYLNLVRRPPPFLPTCRPSVCYTACWLLPTFDSGPLTPSLSHGPPAVRLSYCPPAPTLLLVCRPRHSLTARRPSVGSTTRWLLPTFWSADHRVFVPASRPPICNSPRWHPRFVSWSADHDTFLPAPGRHAL